MYAKVQFCDLVAPLDLILCIWIHIRNSKLFVLLIGL